MASEGDYNKPISFFFTIFIVYLAINSKILNIKRVCCCLLFILFMVNVLSLIRLSIYKFYKQEPFSTVRMNTDVGIKQKPIYRNIKIEANNEDYYFVVKNSPTSEVIYKVLEINQIEGKGRENLLKSLSYKTQPHLHNMLNTNNIYYSDMLNDATNMLSQINIDKSDRVYMLDFANTLPITLDTYPVPYSYHWFHMGISFSSQNISLLNKIFEESDFIYTLLLSRPSLNCIFYNWNLKHKRFFLASISKYGLLFGTDEKIRQYNMKIYEPLNQSEIRKSCGYSQDH